MKFSVIDAGTKLPSGILAGNIADLGQYDECINTQYGNISGQHCLINFVFKLPNTDVSKLHFLMQIHTKLFELLFL